MFTPQRQEAELRRLQRVKYTEPAAIGPMGAEVVHFFKQSVQKRQTKLGKIAEAWGQLVPQLLAEHSALDGLNRGVLTVLVDSSSHLYDLKQLLLAGLEQQLLIACKSAGLRKIALKAGRWYEARSDGEQRVRF